MGCTIVLDGAAGFVEIGVGRREGGLRSYWGQFLSIFPSSPTSSASFFVGKAPQLTMSVDMYLIQSGLAERHADGEFAN